MLTRLKVNGFKNLVDVDVRFGPFTCIAGANGVGKSNLFDAIRFLSLLADNTLIDAALKLRGPNGRTRDIRSLFHHSTDEMSFEAEMIIPRYGKDDLGQDIETQTTVLQYNLVLRYAKTEQGQGLDLVEERLSNIIENTFVL
ncbi:MAG: AAA family ATPase [Anaerolineae bacterium]